MPADNETTRSVNTPERAQKWTRAKLKSEYESRAERNDAAREALSERMKVSEAELESKKALIQANNDELELKEELERALKNQLEAQNLTTEEQLKYKATLEKLQEEMQELRERRAGFEKGGYQNEDGSWNDDALRKLISDEKSDTLFQEEMSRIGKEILEESKQRSAWLGTLNESVTGMNNTMGSLTKSFSSFLKGDISGGIGGLSGTIGGVGDIFSTLDKAGIGGGMFGKGGKATALLGTVAKVLGFAGAALGTVDFAASVNDLFGDLNRTSLQQTGEKGNFGITTGMGLEQNLYGLATNLSARDVQAIQNNMLANRAKYGTQEYRQGVDFAVSATQQYGISADRASSLYANAVLKGTMTVEQLDNALSNLQETVKNSDITMDQALQNFDSMVKTMTGISGGEGAATAASTQITNLLGGDTDLANVASGKIAAAKKSMGDIQFTSRVSEYQRQNPGTSTAQAELMISEEYERMNAAAMYGSNDPRTMMATQAITRDGRRVQDFVDAGDRRGLIQALDELEYNAMPTINMDTIRNALLAYHFPETKINSSEDIADILIGNPDEDKMGYSLAVQNAQGAVENPKAKITSKQLQGSGIQKAIKSGIISESDARNLTAAQAKLIEEASLNGDADETFGYDPVTGTYTYSGLMGGLTNEARIKQIMSMSPAEAAAAVTKQAADVKESNGKIVVELRGDAKKIFYAYYEDENDRAIANAGER